MPTDGFDQLLKRVAEGDTEAISGVLAPLVPGLMGRAERFLRGREMGDVDHADAVQSAVRTFLRRVKKGEFRGLKDSESLRRLLATIAIRKALNALRRARKTINEGALGGGLDSGDSEAALAALVAVPPAEEVDSLCDEWLALLPDDTLRTVAVLAFCGHSRAEIARQLDCTSANIGVKVRRIRDIWGRALQRLADD